MKFSAPLLAPLAVSRSLKRAGRWFADQVRQQLITRNRRLAIVLATDFNPGSSPTPSMPMLLSLACTQMKMSPAEAITAATINAAHSLNRGDKIGSLEPGKLANLAVFDYEDYRELAYWFGFPQTHAVYVKGERVL